MTRNLLLGLTLACAAAVGLAWGFAGERPATAARSRAPDTSALPALRAELAGLRDQIALERAARDTLARELEDVRDELAALRAGTEPVASPPRPGRGRGRANAASASGLDEDALLEAGFALDRVDELRRRLDAIDLERLRLRDRANREGWLQSPRYFDEYRALADPLRETRDEFGDEHYDWALFASGRPNRVEIVDVMAGSPASDVGLEAGDRLVAYAGQRVFGPGELQESTGQGRVGESVAVDFVRDGEERRVYVPRGPLGVRIQPASERPPALR